MATDNHSDADCLKTIESISEVVWHGQIPQSHIRQLNSIVLYHFTIACGRDGSLENPSLLRSACELGSWCEPQEAGKGCSASATKSQVREAIATSVSIHLTWMLSQILKSCLQTIWTAPAPKEISIVLGIQHPDRGWETTGYRSSQLLERPRRCW